MKLWVLLAILLYVIFPYDLLPDFLIGGGWIDDFVALGVLWYLYFYRRKADGKRRANGSGQKERQKGREDFRRRESSSRPEDPVRDPHRILGVRQGASAGEIKAAYRRLAGQYHPDKVVHLGEEFRVLAEAKFKEIQRAYDELSAKSRGR